MNTLPWPHNLQASVLSLMPRLPPSLRASRKGSWGAERPCGVQEPGHKGSNCQSQPSPSLTRIELVHISDFLSQDKLNYPEVISATESPLKSTPICYISSIKPYNCPRRQEYLVSRPSCPTSWLCDLGQASIPLCASLSSPGSGVNSPRPLRSPLGILRVNEIMSVCYSLEGSGRSTR